MEWWKETVFYQIYPRSFCDSNGDGIGDIPGIISKLDYLQELGIGAIWLSPVYPSPNYDNGYDISDYRTINPEYGTLDDMKHLITEAKQRGIKIVMDLVMNHTSDQHPWFIAAADKNSPYRDYYIWKDAHRSLTGKHRPPNNWLSYFTGSAWKWHEQSGQYYLHLFGEHQPDLNFHNLKVIGEIKDIMRYWLAMGVAGFRCDVVNMIYKSSYTNGHYSFFHLPGSHHYFSQPGNHAILRQLREEVLKPYGAFAVGETAGGVDESTARKFVDGELDAVFTFDHLTLDEWGMPFAPRRYKPKRLKKMLIKWQQALPWNALFFENHDTERSLNKFRLKGTYQKQGAMMLATLLLMLKGTPFIYQGEEIGMENYPFKSIAELQDTSSRSIYAVLRHYHMPRTWAFQIAMMVCRDHARTPMQWDPSDGAGFTSGIRPWRPINPNHATINVAAEKDDAGSLYNYYRNLINLRNSHTALRDGELIIIPASNNVLAFRRTDETTQYEIIINLSPKQQRYSLPEGEYVFGNYGDYSATRYTLRPYETIIIKIVSTAT